MDTTRTTCGILNLRPSIVQLIPPSARCVNTCCSTIDPVLFTHRKWKQTRSWTIPERQCTHSTSTGKPPSSSSWPNNFTAHQRFNPWYWVARKDAEITDSSIQDALVCSTVHDSNEYRQLNWRTKSIQKKMHLRLTQQTPTSVSWKVSQSYKQWIASITPNNA